MNRVIFLITLLSMISSGCGEGDTDLLRTRRAFSVNSPTRFSNLNEIDFADIQLLLFGDIIQSSIFFDEIDRRRAKASLTIDRQNIELDFINCFFNDFGGAFFIIANNERNVLNVEDIDVASDYIVIRRSFFGEELQSAFYLSGDRLLVWEGFNAIDFRDNSSATFVSLTFQEFQRRTPESTIFLATGSSFLMSGEIVCPQ